MSGSSGMARVRARIGAYVRNRNRFPAGRQTQTRRSRGPRARAAGASPSRGAGVRPTVLGGDVRSIVREREVDFQATWRYHLGMKVNTKSSITLPPEELKLVVALQAKLKAKSKVEVVRRGLRLLKETTDRESLREAYRRASLATRRTLTSELQDLDHLSSEGLDER